MEEDQPKSITFSDHIFDFSLHPSQNIAAVGLITGYIQCHNYSASTDTLQWNTKISNKSCRGVEFTENGLQLLSISRDKSIQALDVHTGRLLYRIPKAHKYAINKISNLDTHLTATGDDEGVIKIWDMRVCKSVQEYKVHDDFISDMVYHQSSLLATGGDGLLSLSDLRQLNTDKVILSDKIEDELLSLSVLKNGHKVVSGSQTGALYSWDWGKWDEYDKWLGHPNSVDSICKLDEDTICTGGSDGLLRLITIATKQQFEGILGDHGDDFPIERVRMNHNQHYLASCGHDLQLRFWNVRFLFEDTTKRGREESEEDNQSMKRAKTRAEFFDPMYGYSYEPSSPDTPTVGHHHGDGNYVSYATTANKFDASDDGLDSLLDNNRRWAQAVLEQDPSFFDNIAEKQEPKILWIGCSDSRVPANQIVQLGPGEMFVHRNIANVVNHSDLNCLSVLQYAVEVLKVEHIIVCGHYNCGGVAAAMGSHQYGLIDNWLRSIKDVYRLNREELKGIDDEKERTRRLVELNALNSAKNVCHSTIVQNAWSRGQKLIVHAWAYDLTDGIAKKLEYVAEDECMVDSIYVSKA
ncbi:carbonic anhydrase [Pilobolus umbonatus]|nr:carbonic anhydrase [Pilobolus umbonatus]